MQRSNVIPYLPDSVSRHFINGFLQFLYLIGTHTIGILQSNQWHTGYKYTVKEIKTHINPVGFIYRIGTNVQRTAGITGRFQAVMVNSVPTDSSNRLIVELYFTVFLCMFEYLMYSEKKLGCLKNGTSP